MEGATAGGVLSRIPLLDNNNYLLWKVRVKNYLEAKGLWESVILSEELEKPRADDPKLAEKLAVWSAWKKRNFEVLSILTSTMTDSKLRIYINEQSARNLWLSLERAMSLQARRHCLQIGKELTSITKTRNESIIEYLDRAQDIAARSVATGEKIPEERLVFYVLEGLPKEYRHIVRILQMQTDINMDQVRDHLIMEESRNVEETNVQTRESAFHLGTRTRRRHGEGANKRGSGSTRNQGPKVCYSCGTPGHIARFCPKKEPPPRQQTKEKFRPNEKNYNERKYGHRRNEMSLVAIDTLNGKRKADGGNSEWILDSGATVHVTSSDEGMFDVSQAAHCLFTAKAGQTASVEKEGKMILTTNVSKDVHTTMNLQKVLHVPEARNNLMSVYRIVQGGYKVIFSQEGVKILDEVGRLMATGLVRNSMFVLTTNSQEPIETSEANAVQYSKELWHRRLAHASEQYLDCLSRQQMVIGLTYPDKRLELCDACMRGKSTMLPYKARTENPSSRNCLQLLHVDLCGPMQEKSLGGSSYVLTVMDDYSRRSFVFFMSLKSDVYEHLSNFVTSQERRTGLKVQAIRSDNGGEFVNEQLNSWLTERGIKHELTVPYAPQSNGVAERLNRTLLDKARTILIEAGLPFSFWAEAVNYANYTRNALPCKGIDGTPLERWLGKKPSVAHLRVFGCLAYVVTPKQRRRKLDPRARRMIFIGYAANRKAYRVFDPDSRKVCEVRNVYFDERVWGSNLLKEQGMRHQTQIWIENDGTNGHSVEEQDPERPSREPTSLDEEPEPDGDRLTSDEDSKTARPQRSRGRPAGTNAREMERRRQLERRELEKQRKLLGLRQSQRVQRDGDQAQQVQGQNLPCKVPETYEEALSSPQADQWRAAMEEEIAALTSHQVWTLTERPKVERIMKSKWVFKIKTDVEGNISRYKARLVAVGCSMREGVDYDQVFSPVVRLESLRLLVATAAHRNLEMRHYDVKNAYLHGDLKAHAFMEQPPGFENDNHSVCRLQRSIYGLPHAGKCWNEKLHRALTEIGFAQSDIDPCVYVYKKGTDVLLLAVYVDDLAVFSTTRRLREEIMNRVGRYFELVDLGELRYFLGIEIVTKPDSVSLGQQKYVQELLSEFNMEQCRPVDTPAVPGENLDDHEKSADTDRTLYQRALGMLNWLMLATRPDLCYAITNLARFASHPKQVHWKAITRVMRYIKATSEYVLIYRCGQTAPKLEAEVDASWDSTSDSKSFSGYLISLGTAVIHWKTRKQRTVALSTCESEMMAIHEVSKELSWFRSLLWDVQAGTMAQVPTIVKTDSQSAIACFQKGGRIGRTKHMTRKYMYTKDEMAKGNLKLCYQSSVEVMADALTKPLSRDILGKHAKSMGLRRFSTKGGSEVLENQQPRSLFTAELGVTSTRCGEQV